MLRRFADRIVLLFDADTAGDSGGGSGGGIVSDPADRNCDRFDAQRSGPGRVPVTEWGWRLLARSLKGRPTPSHINGSNLVRQFDAGNGDLTSQQKAVEAYLELLASARGSGPVDALRWGSALARVSRLTDIPVDELNRRFRRSKPVPPRPQAVAPAAQSVVPKSYPARPLTAQDRAERQILGILLVQPHRWHEVQRVVHLEDFVHEGHRCLAEIYWNHQRDEGEPVFNEFLGSLGEPALTEIAMLAVDEVEALNDPDRVLSEALAWLEHQRRVQGEQKLLAALRRNSEGPLRVTISNY